MNLKIKLSHFALPLFLTVAVTSCSVVSDKPERLSGLVKMEKWKVQAENAKAKGASEALYTKARAEVNKIASDELPKEVDKTKSFAIFGIGGTVDLSESAILSANPQAETKVNEYLNSTTKFGSSSVDWAALAKVLFDWGKDASESYREESAEELKKRIANKSVWPEWKDL